MNCSICGEKIVLSPSAAERAQKFGGKPSDYTALFTTHSDCAIKKRKKDTAKLMRQIRRVDNRKSNELWKPAPGSIFNLSN